MGFLFRKREVWLPSLWGCVMFAAMLGACLTVVGRGLNDYLSQNAPVGAPTLIVEGWLTAEALDQAATVARTGRYARVITTGGPVDKSLGGCGYPTYAEQAAAYLRGHGLGGLPVDAVAAPASKQDRTFLSAVVVRDWLKDAGGDRRAIDVFSDGAHARRTRILYEMAFGPGTHVGIYAAKEDGRYETPWWSDAQSVRYTVDQAITLLWVECCFRAPPQGSHEERWFFPRKN